MQVRDTQLTSHVTCSDVTNCGGPFLAWAQLVCHCNCMCDKTTEFYA